MVQQITRKHANRFNGSYRNVASRYKTGTANRRPLCVLSRSIVAGLAGHRGHRFDERTDSSKHQLQVKRESMIADLPFGEHPERVFATYRTRRLDLEKKHAARSEISLSVAASGNCS